MRMRLANRGPGRISLGPRARLTTKLLIIALGLALTLIRFPASSVERFYSTGFYSSLQSLLTTFSNLVPFSIADVLIVALAVGLPAWWIVRLKRTARGRRGQASGRLALHTTVLAAAVVCAFELLWGLNYQRPPLTTKLDWDRQRVTFAASVRLARVALDNVNAESAAAHAGEWPGDQEMRTRLHESFEQVVTELGNRPGFVPAEPKRSLLNLYLRTAGLAGFTNPFGHEVILDPELLPFEKPYTLAHEWAHLAGFADESEASFVGLLTCLRSDAPEIRYSAWLELYQHIGRPLEPGQDPNTLEPWPPLAPEVQDDLRAISERVRRHYSRTIGKAQAGVYDRFLKANRVEAGIASYGLLVRLLLGARFDENWVPAQRQGR
ncbi:MAG TPA: DUF3810 domain-containing protein [Blastocatellia bacterium]|nr:DUF3810 domain-containing protein [Blastocatellia bacterium]